MAVSNWRLFRSKDDEEPPARRRESENPFRQLQREMNRVFENFFEGGGRMRRRGGGPEGSEMTRPEMPRSEMMRPSSRMGERFNPRVDVSEDEEMLNIRAELPGMSKDDIELYCDDDSLTIKGQKEEEKTSEEEGYYRQERSYGYFQRTVPFPVDVDTDNAQAQFEDGILNVRFPKTGEAKGQQLEIE